MINYHIYNRNILKFLFSITIFQIISISKIDMASHINHNVNIEDNMDLRWLWLIIPGGYVLISTFFLCFPNILHKRKQYRNDAFNQLAQSQTLFCIAHRGGSCQGPENTLEIFRKTAKVCHLFELDICVTKDGLLVINHDPNLKRTCGVDKQITQVNFDQLPPLSQATLPYGGDELIKTNRNSIPLLEDLFKEFPNMLMNVDLKTPTQQAMKEFNRLIKKYKRQNLTIWGTSEGQNNTILRQMNPQITNFYSQGQILKITLLFLSGLLPFVCLRQGAIQIPLLTQELKIATNQMNGCLRCLMLCVVSFFNLMSRLFIPHLRKRGILTFYWIINKEEDFKRAAATGCAGIMSDRPTKLAGFLKSSNLYFQSSSDSFC